MWVRLSNIWESLRTNYWLIPATMTTAAVGLAFLTHQIDLQLRKKAIQNWEWIWTGAPEGAREVLSTIASSMITVAGVTFSITIVALAQASSQFGPRLLRTFIRDTGNQVVLGTFVSTFIYCLLVLRTVHGSNENYFVPNLSVTCALVLSLFSLGVLIYFIHHVCLAIQAENLVANVGLEFERSIQSHFPEAKSSEPETESTPPDLPHPDDAAAFNVCSQSTGYLQAVDYDSLKESAVKNSAVYRVLHHGGDFIAEGTCLVTVQPMSAAAGDLNEEVCDAFIFGRRRTPTQDVDYLVHQLVEIAVRALSPGVNDPFTAVSCVDWLGAGLISMLHRKLPPGTTRDSEGTIRVIHHHFSFEHTLAAAFNQIRQNSSGNVAVSIRLLETLQSIAEQAGTREQKAAIAEHVEKIMHDVSTDISNPWDLKAIGIAHAHALSSLHKTDPRPTK